MRRGEVRWLKFKPPNKHRPVVILTRDSALGYLNDVSVAPITSKIRDIPTEVLLSNIDGLSKPCVVNLDHINTVPKEKLGSVITMLSSERLDAVCDAAAFVLGFKFNK